jgi:hypothetical protein
MHSRHHAASRDRTQRAADNNLLKAGKSPRRHHLSHCEQFRIPYSSMNIEGTRPFNFVGKQRSK